MALTVKDIAWAAGFLEGEGHFGHTGGSPLITAAQVERAPIEKLQQQFGGQIRLHHPTNSDGAKRKDAWVWYICGTPAASLMMTFYSLLLQKQPAIKRALDLWRVSRGRAELRTTCPKGHPYDETNTYNGPGPRRVCRICKRADGQRRYHAGLDKNRQCSCHAHP